MTPIFHRQTIFTPLGLAVHVENIKIVELLLSYHNVDPNIGTPIFFPILSRRSSSTILEMLVSDERIDINAKVNGKTPLYNAVKNNIPTMVECLLSHTKIDVNCQNDDEETPLYRAVDIIKPDIVKSLLANKNINVNLKTKGITPFDHALAIFIFLSFWHGPMNRELITFLDPTIKDIIIILNLLREKGATVTEKFKFLEVNDLKRYTLEESDDELTIDFDIEEENKKMKTIATQLLIEQCSKSGNTIDIDKIRYTYMAFSKEINSLNKECNDTILKLLETHEKRLGRRFHLPPVEGVPVKGGSGKKKKTKRRHNKKRKSVKRKPIKNSSLL